jgi:hypothetical protein
MFTITSYKTHVLSIFIIIVNNMTIKKWISVLSVCMLAGCTSPQASAQAVSTEFGNVVGATSDGVQIQLQNTDETAPLIINDSDDVLIIRDNMTIEASELKMGESVTVTLRDNQITMLEVKDQNS